MHIGDYIRKVEEAFVEERSALEISLGSGHCSSYDQYTKACGEIAGLHRASAVLADTLKQLNEEDADD